MYNLRSCFVQKSGFHSRRYPFHDNWLSHRWTMIVLEQEVGAFERCIAIVSFHPRRFSTLFGRVPNIDGLYFFAVRPERLRHRARGKRNQDGLDDVLRGYRLLIRIWPQSLSPFVDGRLLVDIRTTRERP